MIILYVLWLFKNAAVEQSTAFLDGALAIPALTCWWSCLISAQMG